MALGERFRGTGSSGVAEFLAEHESCDAGFDVSREAGPGRGQLVVACTGCGRSVEYRAAEAAEMANGFTAGNGERIALQPAPGTPQPPGPTQAPHARRPVPPPPPARPSRLGRPAWLPNLLIAAIILGGIGLIVAGLLRSGDDPGSPPDAASSANPPQEALPAQPLRRRVFFDRFAIGVPRGWRLSAPGGNLDLVAPGGAARVRVFSDSPALDPSELVGPTANFLAEEHPGAEISKPKPVSLGGRPAIQVRAVYEGGEEVASVISAAGFSFLLTYLRRDAADEAVVEQGEASFASFRPR